MSAAGPDQIKPITASATANIPVLGSEKSPPFFLSSAKMSPLLIGAGLYVRGRCQRAQRSGRWSSLPVLQVKLTSIKRGASQLLPGEHIGLELVSRHGLNASLARYVIKRLPFAEQVVLLAMLPVVAGIEPCASLLFRGHRREPHTVHAVRCAYGGFASGTYFMGVGRGMSMLL